MIVDGEMLTARYLVVVVAVAVVVVVVVVVVVIKLAHYLSMNGVAVHGNPCHP